MKYQTKDFRKFRRILGHNIATIRQSKSLTLEQLSKRTGFSADLIKRFEQGRRIDMRINVLFRLACGLDVGVERLINNTG